MSVTNLDVNSELKNSLPFGKSARMPFTVEKLEAMANGKSISSEKRIPGLDGGPMLSVKGHALAATLFPILKLGGVTRQYSDSLPGLVKDFPHDGAERHSHPQYNLFTVQEVLEAEVKRLGGSDEQVSPGTPKAPGGPASQLSPKTPTAKTPTTPTAKTPTKVRTKRLTKADLPGKFTVQTGEIFWSEEKDEAEFMWDHPCIVDLEWSDECNLEKEPGISLGDGGWGYAGFGDGIYGRYDTEISANEHCFRILE
jgi:hypothetical protein